MVASTGRKVMRLNSVLETLDVSKSTIYSWIRDGIFPPPVRLGTRSVGWHAETVEAWIASRESAKAEGADERKPNVSDLRVDMMAKIRTAEKAAYAYFCACEIGEERTRAHKVYENIRNATRV